MIWFLTSEMCKRVQYFPYFGSKNCLNDKEEDLGQFRKIHVKYKLYKSILFLL